MPIPGNKERTFAMSNNPNRPQDDRNRQQGEAGNQDRNRQQEQENDRNRRQQGEEGEGRQQGEGERRQR